MSSDPQKIHFLDTITAIAIVRMIFVHAWSNYWIYTHSEIYHFQNTPYWTRILHLLTYYNVPIFVLVAGIKFGLSNFRFPERPVSKYISKRFHRLYIPFLIWSFIYYFLVRLLTPEIAQTSRVFDHFPFPTFHEFWMILSGVKPTAYQLWFIPMLFFVACIYAILRKVIKNTWVALILFAIGFFFIIHWHVQAPANYLRFLLIYHMGVMAAPLLVKPIKSHQLAGFVLISSLFTAMTMLMKWFNLIPLWSENLLYVFIPVTFSSLVYLFSKQNFKIENYILAFSAIGWPLYIMHEPLILCNIGRTFYLRFHLETYPFFILTGILTILTTYLVYRILKAMRLNTLLF